MMIKPNPNQVNGTILPKASKPGFPINDGKSASRIQSDVLGRLSGIKTRGSSALLMNRPQAFPYW
jgi:hypothetical protein